MIKQTWDISLEEKERILGLHESATKNLYLIKEQNELQSTQTGIPKNVNFSFSMKSIGQRMSLDARTDEQGNVYVEWQGQERRLPSVQEIGVPKFKILNDYNLSTIDEWEWLNSLNNDMATNVQAQGIPFYIPSYDKSTSQLHFLRYEPVSLDRREKRSKTESNDFLQANDGKFMTIGNYSLMLKGDDLPTADRITASQKRPPTPSREISLNLNISDPFQFDSTNLTPTGQRQFDSFVENLKKYVDLYSGDVEVITSASIDADPKDKETYNMNLSLRRANAIISALKNRLGPTKLNFVPRPLGQTDQFAPGLKFPDVKDKSQTAPNRRLIINLPKKTVTG